MPTVSIEHYTDPGCPFAFSAEPARLRLAWLYGDQLEWRTRMVVLSESTAEMEAKGFDPGKLAAGFRGLGERHGMPIDWSERPRLAASLPACRAVVAARLHAPEGEEPLLRALRVRSMGGGLLDDPALIAAAAADAGIAPPALLREAVEDPAVEDALRADMAAARSPSPAARALDHKLGGPAGERRYTCPSYEFSADGAAHALPGFQPVEAYEAAVANLAPEATRRDAPEDLAEVLAWAPYPLATAELAAVSGREAAEVHVELSRSAAFTPVGADGYWRAA